MSRIRLAAWGVAACLLVAGCASNAFEEIKGDEPIIPADVRSPEKLHTRRSLGEHGAVTYVAGKNYDDEVCLLMYLTQDPPTFIVGCSGSSAVELVGGQGVGEAAFYSEGVPGGHLQLEGGEQVSDWLVIKPEEGP